MRPVLAALAIVACTATPAPTATPNPSVATAGVTYFVEASARRGATGTVVLATAPGARCRPAFVYPGGPSVVGDSARPSASPVPGLDERAADTGGRIRWTWNVDARTPPGSWLFEATCDGTTVSTHVPVE